MLAFAFEIKGTGESSNPMTMLERKYPEHWSRYRENITSHKGRAIRGRSFPQIASIALAIRRSTVSTRSSRTATRPHSRSFLPSALEALRQDLVGVVRHSVESIV